MRQILKTLALVAWLTGGLPAPARAQMFDGLAGNLAMDRLILENGLGRNTRANTRGNTARANATNAPSLDYAPALPALRQQTVTTYAERVHSANPAAAQAVVASFGPGGAADYQTTYATLIKDTGLRANNASDALAALFVAGYRVAHADAPAGPLLPPALVRGVRTQLAARATALAGAVRPNMLATAGEQLKLQTVLIYAGSLGSADKQPAFRQQIAQMLKTSFSLDVAHLSLTDKGFVKQ